MTAFSLPKCSHLYLISILRSVAFRESLNPGVRFSSLCLELPKFLTLSLEKRGIGPFRRHLLQNLLNSISNVRIYRWRFTGMSLPQLRYCMAWVLMSLHYGNVTGGISIIK